MGDTVVSAPAVLVSSTFYDLRQVRADLADFLGRQLGYTPLLSELPSFPVDPDADTVENCRRRVLKDADVLVLVVGGRYGSVGERTAKSITNLEYLAARAKRIPIYVFVLREIIDILPVWARNPEADYASVVDTARLFEFVKSIRADAQVWTFPFSTAQDIVTTLRCQLAHLVHESLQLRSRFASAPLANLALKLSPTAARVLLEQPPAWEYRLFFQAWIDEIEQRSDSLRTYDAQLPFGDAETVSAGVAANWFQTRLHELRAAVDSANHLVNVSAQEGFGPPGQPGNPHVIVWTASRLGAVLDSLIAWTLRMRRARVDAPFDVVATAMARFPESAIEHFRRFPVEALENLDSYRERASQGEKVVRQLAMVLDLANLGGCLEALAEAEREFLSGGG